MNRVQLSALPWTEQKSPGGKFRSSAQNISLALGGIRNVGAWGGGHPFDVQIRRVPAGAAVCPFHLHVAQWETFLVRRGTGTVRTATARHAVRPGDVFVQPPGHAHQLINTGDSELEVLIVADNPPLDAFFYPDSKKWGLRPPGKFFRALEVDYFEGEDAPVEPAPGPLTLDGATGGFRKLHLDEVAWETWTSPKGKFRGTSKELSIALGAKRNTPTGLGGHPFDLEWSTLAPGETGCPFHSHAAQWEMFMILSGTARVRAGTETEILAAGDVVLHPPREPHQIVNAGADELVFLLIADNPLVEYWHYPDANKWGFREPRKFFRLAEAEYYDGEE